MCLDAVNYQSALSHRARINQARGNGPPGGRGASPAE